MGKRILVTGASRGIGRALVEQLASRGHRVLATARDTAALRELQQSTECAAIGCDLTGPPQAVEQLFRDALGELGELDVLVNNAGFNSRKAPVHETTDDEWAAQYAVNLRAPYVLCRAAMAHMVQRGEGHILNVLSSVCRTHAAEMGVYSAMKHGLMGLTKAMIKEGTQHNVKVTGVYPGGTDTSFRSAARPAYMRPESAAAMLVQAIEAPADVVVHELTYRPIVETNF